MRSDRADSRTQTGTETGTETGTTTGSAMGVERAGSTGVGRNASRRTLTGAPEGRDGPRSMVTGEEIIEELVHCMEESLEPLKFSVLAPSLYDVYLHRSDLDRLVGILPRLKQEARQALDIRLAELNAAPAGSALKRLLGSSKSDTRKYESVAKGWTIEFFENTDADSRAGMLQIDARLTYPPGPELEDKSQTRRIRFQKKDGQSRRVADVMEPTPEERPEPVGSRTGPRSPVRPSLEQLRTQIDPHRTTDKLGNPTPTAQSRIPEVSAQSARAQLRYTDQSGTQTIIMDQAELAVGRGGAGHWVDVQLKTVPDVSRTHFLIRRDERGRFFIRDVSAYGTAVNGHRLPCSMDQQGDRRIDKKREEQLPPFARIVLADLIHMEFEVMGA